MELPKAGSRWIYTKEPERRTIIVKGVYIEWRYETNGHHEMIYQASPLAFDPDSPLKTFEPVPELIEPGSVWVGDGDYARTFVVYEVLDGRVFGRSNDEIDHKINGDNRHWYGDDYSVEIFRKRYKRKAD